MNTTRNAPDWDKLVVEKAIGEGINSGNRGVAEARREQRIAKRYARWQRDQLRDRAAADRVKQALREGGLDESGLSEIVQDVIAALVGDQ